MDSINTDLNLLHADSCENIVQYFVHTLCQNSANGRTFGLCSGKIHDFFLRTKDTRERKRAKNTK